jgi:hypothetical protein
MSHIGAAVEVIAAALHIAVKELFEFDDGT